MRRYMQCTDRDGRPLELAVRGSLPVTARRARYLGFHPETVTLRKGSVRLDGYAPLTCDIVLERDVAVRMRDGVTIYVDVFRPTDEARHPAIIAMSPYGKEIGTQWLDDTPDHAGVPKGETSGLQKFEGPDPAYWCAHGYAVINPDVRGAYNSEGVMLFFGSDYGRDGYDLVEWCAGQPWCNGRVGMSGNSWLAISQWFTAAQRPPHLAAIAPWEGLSDCYREVATRGGIPQPIFLETLSDSLPSTAEGGIEDVIREMAEHPTQDAFWADKEAQLENIDVPAYVVASYTNPIHVMGSIEGFRRISSADKWLRIHNTGEWDDYYKPEHVEDLRRFFDRYLMGAPNGWEATPRVRMAILDPGGHDVVDQPEEDFPPARARTQRLYLDAGRGRLQEGFVADEASRTYDSSDRHGKAVFRYRMPQDTDLCGPMRLHLWAAADDADDMDLVVKVEKRNPLGWKIPGKVGPGIELAAKGYVRASLRGLDETRSTECAPYQSMERVEKLTPGVPVALDILIWPMAMRFRKGDVLQVTVAAYKSVNLEKMPFKLTMAKVSVPKEGFTRMPGERVEMQTVGGCDLSEVPEDGRNVDLSHDCNVGRHTVYTGGRHEGWLAFETLPDRGD